MKILYITTIGTTMNFFKTFIKELIDKGDIIDIATNTDIADVSEFYKDLNCNIYKISCQRTPFSFNNLKAIKEIKKLVENNHYDIVHCHTPVASICTRLACKDFRKSGGKVIYTCHGFHFHKKSSKLNWLLFYPAEKICSKYTDVIITINKEDFQLAKKLNAKDVKYIPGIGIDVERIENSKINRKDLLNKLSIPDNSFIIASTGELSKRKNFSVIIKAIGQLKCKDIYYLICGEGNMKDNLLSLVNDLDISKNVIFLGQKNYDEVINICHLADIGAIPSLIEGLGLAGLEYMAAGKPVIGSNVHGINDYLINGETGISCNPNNVNEFAEAIMSLKNNKELYEKCSNNAKNISKQFDYKLSQKIMNNIYDEVLKER